MNARTVTSAILATLLSPLIAVWLAVRLLGSIWTEIYEGMK